MRAKWTSLLALVWAGSVVVSSGAEKAALEMRPQPWRRLENPILSARTTTEDWCRVVLYSPFVIRHEGRFRMWYGGHRDGGLFELFCAESDDGSNWRTRHAEPAFPAAPGKEQFDSRYTSTPCVVKLSDRWLLYYSARDWNREYVGADGVKRRDGSSPYSHVGLATLPRPDGR